MPKTKLQKQQEALERKLASIKKMRVSWLYAAPGGGEYNRIKSVSGEEAAIKNFDKIDQMFKKACSEAGVDRHGNPLSE